MKEMLSLSWDAHLRNISGGLSHLQQKGEFVDMTLAADGHLVKVHQMVVSLASPYIKELISSAPCPHPVIFLNNISHTTLIAVLEYIYTGEVHIAKDGLSDFLAAGKALHIKGLKEMSEDVAAGPRESIQTHSTERKKPEENATTDETRQRKLHEVFVSTIDVDCDDDMTTEPMEMSNTNVTDDHTDEDLDNTASSLSKPKKNEEFCNTDVNFSMSNQGNLQLVVNRFIYNLKYIRKNNNKYWRCVEYSRNRCPACVHTSDGNVVLERKGAHNHPFHDSKIIKKIRKEIIFKAFSEAESRAAEKKREKDS